MSEKPDAAARVEEKREPAPSRYDDAKSEAALRPVLLVPSSRPSDPELARTFKSWGVGPTIDTAEEPTSRVDLDLDTASYALARAAIAAGELPPEASVRVEEFLAAIPPASPPPADRIAIEIDAMDSPQRTGYRLLRIAVRAPRGEPTPIDVVFAIDATAAMNDDLGAARDAVIAAARARKRDERIGVVLVGARAQEIVPLGDADPRALAKALATLDETTAQKPASDLGLPAVFRSFDPARAAHVVALTSGVLPGTDPQLAELLAREAAAGRRTSALGLGDTPYDDATLERIAHAGRGRYLFADDAARTLEHARKPVVAISPRLTVRFDPAAVMLYRLVGYEGRSEERSGDGPGTEPSVLVAGDTATVLYELRLTDDPPARWGEAELQFTAPAGKAESVLAPIERLEGGDADLRLAALAAGTAEKLRGSYWARRVQWTDLAALHGKLPASVRRRADVAELGRLIDALHELDRRGDRFEARTPQARMDFDRLPVIE